MTEAAEQQFEMDYKDRPVTLVIAGSDSGGGAGIQADLKTLSFYGVHGTTALTSVTAQNSVGVQGAQHLDPEFVQNQIQTIVSDFRIDSVKTGMLAHAGIVEAVAETIQEHALSNLVVDPVMFAESGDRLLEEDAIVNLVNELFPLATVITPNIPEAEALLDRTIDSFEEMEEAAHTLSENQDCAVVLKGGHLEEDAVDVLAYQGQLWNTRGPRVHRSTTHGSGCAFASAIAANLAMDHSIGESVERTKNFITEAIRWGSDEGKGAGSVEPGWGKFRATEVQKLQMALTAALEELRHTNFAQFIPEVQSNFVFALENARLLKDVVGFPGRIVRVEDHFRILEQPSPGGTDHMGRLVLAAMEKNPTIRSAINIRYDEGIVEAARAAGLDCFEHERDSEPDDVREEEGKSIRYAVERTFEMNGKTLPDLMFDRGAKGKEAMVRILGTDPGEVLESVRKISRNYEEDPPSEEGG